MKDGIERVYPSYELLMDTGRTSSRSPNIQQVPKNGPIRSLFRARQGNLFFIADFKAVELCSLAQVCFAQFGKSRMAEFINKGVDLHRETASKMFGKQPDEISNEERQYAKAVNFGFPGGLGAASFVAYALSGYGVRVTLEEAKSFRANWMKTFPEMEMYMADQLEHHPILKTNPLQMESGMALGVVRKVAKGVHVSAAGKPYSAKLLAWARANCNPRNFHAWATI